MRYKKTLIAVAVFLIIIPPIAFALSIIFPNQPLVKNVAPVFKKIERKVANPIGGFAKNILLNKEGEYGIYIKNLKTNEEYSFQKDKKFDSASLYKLWVMAVAHQKIKDGTLSEDQLLSAPAKKLDDTLSTVTPTPLQDGAPPPTPEEEKFISMRTSEAIFKMITVSDNYAALLVASRSGSVNIANFIKDSKFTNSNFKQPPQTSAADVGKFFEMLYLGKVVDKNHSDRMLELLKQQALNDRIPKYLPDDIEIAHKTGELFGAKHDAGIVFSKKGDYIIVVLTNTDDSAEAAERIAKFSKAVFDYLQN